VHFRKAFAKEKRALRTFATAMAASTALGLAAQSCGVMVSPDCEQRANCPENAAQTAADGTIGVGVDEAGASPEGGGEDIPRGDGAAGADRTGGDVTGGDTAIEKAGSDADSREVVNQEVGSEDRRSQDVESGSVTPVDACTPTSSTEDCTNGIDDDCDGKIDCADPQCSAYACAAPLPAGWSTPVAFWQGPDPAASPGCQPNFGGAIHAGAGLNAPAAMCGSCACGISVQPTCSTSGTFHPDQACLFPTCNLSDGGVATITVAPASGACTAVPANLCGSGGSFTMGPALPAATGGSCGVADAGSVNVPPSSWGASAQVCAYAGPMDSPGGCANEGEQCVAKPTGSGVGATLCVYSTMDPPPTSCPAGYSAQAPAVFYRSVMDTRTCSSCSCGSPTGASCSGTVNLYGTSAGGCTGLPGAIYVLGAICQGYTGVFVEPGYVQANYTVNGATCSVAAQPQPSGSATVTQPITICCMG
jgi:hypothetical protein